MAQFAAHIAVGVAAGDLLEGRQELRYGLVIGSFAPDLDFVLLLAFYLFDPTLARSFHRYASHSLFIPALILVLSAMGYWLTRKDRIMYWGMGLAAGLVTHVILDMVFWFDQVTVLWPLDLFGVSSTVDLWQGYEPPEPVYLLLGPAAEFLCYGLLFLFLRRRMQSPGSSAALGPTLNRAKMISFITFGVFVFLIAVLGRSTYEEAAYGVAAVVFAPLSLYLLWRMRDVIGARSIE